ncbi:helix-turn-helix domain-containing protein [Actinomadura oligospora]|uniref:helix-turn-helix domain-containing protein n=1 Tax=Actinomadura oligospora TaxID=111804 RepID=UPI0004798E25|nr:helix-turn-helix transcriptional regulator [Actinomadura oligospora]
MGRPLKRINPDDGPVARFALELRALRQQAGNLPYGRMSRKCGVSRSALSKAAGGEQIPSEQILDAFVGVCGGDLNFWRVRRLQALREVEAAAKPGTALVPIAPQEPTGDPDIPGEPLGQGDGDAELVPAARRPSDLASPPPGRVRRWRSAAVDRGTDASIRVEVIDAEVLEDARMRRVLVAAGRRYPHYLAGAAVLVATAAVTAMLVRPTHGTTTVRSEATPPVSAPTPPSSGGTLTPSPSTPSTTGTGSPSPGQVTPSGTGGASPSPNAQVPPGHTPPSGAPGPGPGGDGNGGDGGSGDQPVRRTGTVVMVPGSSHEIDLDSLAPTWTTSAARSRVNDLEFRIADRRLTAVDPAVVANLPAGSTGTWHQCATQQVYTENGRPETGALMCVITSERRYALLHVTSVHHTDGQPDRIALDIKVWEPRNAS